MSRARTRRDMSGNTSWKARWRRCTDSRHRAYRWYGARGIVVCDHWRVYANFIADMGPKPPGTTLDRIDSAGDYEPRNCRWAGWDVQARNRRPRQRQNVAPLLQGSVISAISLTDQGNPVPECTHGPVLAGDGAKWPLPAEVAA